MLKLALEASTELAQQGIDCEVIDPRTIKPLDIELISQSVKKTNRLLIVEEGHYFCGFAAEVIAQIQEKCFDDLDAPITRLSQNENPLPYAKNLEAKSIPNKEKIVQTVKKILHKKENFG